MTSELPADPTWRQKLELLRLVTRRAFEADRRNSLIVFVLGPAGVIITAGYGLILKLLTDSIVQRNESKAELAAGSLALLVGLAPLQWRTFATASATLLERTMRAFERKLISDSLALPGIEHHERPDYLDRLTALRVRLRDFACPGAIGGAINATLAIFASLILLAWVSPALICLPLFALPLAFVSPRAERILQSAEHDIAPSRRLRESLFNMLTQASPGKELRIFELREELASRHRNEWQLAIKRLGNASLKHAALLCVGWTAYALGILIGLLFLVWRATSQHATPGDAMLFVTVAQGINQQVAEVVYSATGLQRVFEIGRDWLWLEELGGRRIDANGRTRRKLPCRIEHSIALENVTFRYPETTVDALKDLELELPANSVTALVGENGAGKSTIAKLLCRFYEPDAGRITLDGNDIAGFDPVQWRSLLTGSFQDFARFEFLLKESVGTGSLDHLDDLPRVRDALRRAGAEELERSVPHGLLTQLGHNWENGVDLSLGQWQKVALGRAFMRERPLLVLLDEPTASLDAQAEYALFQRFRATSRALARQGAITLLISHRFSTVRTADLIVVIEDGCVIESGNHATLMRRRGRYAELYLIQAEGYARKPRPDTQQGTERGETASAPD